MQRSGARERILSNKLPCREESDCGFLTPMRNYGNPCSAILQVKQGLRGLALAEERFLGLQFNHRPARPSMCKICGWIESSAAIAGQNATSLWTVRLAGMFWSKRQVPWRGPTNACGE